MVGSFGLVWLETLYPAQLSSKSRTFSCALFMLFSVYLEAEQGEHSRVKVHAEVGEREKKEEGGREGEKERKEMERD